MIKIRLLTVIALAGLAGFAADAVDSFPPQPPIPYLSPAEELKSFELKPGYHLELVLSEPDIKEPVIVAFDGNGRMFVAEMRTYMQEIDGKNEHAPLSRVSMHWSSKGDGHFDKHSVFVDNMVLPRLLLPYGDGVLIGETDTSDIYLYRDTNGDGVSEQKTLWFAGGPRGGNLEHQPNGLLLSLDNWMYSTYNAYRLRARGTNVIKEATGSNGGQWGICQDNLGKPWFVNAGGERGPLNFQQPIVYGEFGAKGEFADGYPEVWPLVGLADVQGGKGRFRPENKTLNHFTATCGNEFFRGDRLPADLRGDLLFSEPVGRLIRRTKVEVTDGITRLRNAYEKDEFIRSTDANFRAVNMTTAPDGTLFIVDMYRGIIQEGNWVRKGDYLRKVVEQYSMQNNFGRGRIWRLVHDDFKPGPQPRMNEESSEKLVTRLEHPNGWWRDTAQKLIVLRHDKSVVPALEKMARSNKNALARIHALWTLEGLDAATPALIREKLKDESPQVRTAAIRVSESNYKNGDKSVIADVEGMAKDKDPNVIIQAMLTANLLKFPESKALIEKTLAANSSEGVEFIGRQLITPPKEEKNTIQFTAAEKQLLDHGRVIYRELCFSCHGLDGKGFVAPGTTNGTTLGPPLKNSKLALGFADGPINVVLNGMAGPVDGKIYTAQMIPMKNNSDEWVAAVVSYIRNSFGNHASCITTQQVAMARAATASRTEPWDVEELHAALPKALKNQKQWKLSASHNKGSVPAAVDGYPATRYDSGGWQTPGMWFQVELPQETTVTALQLDSTPSPEDFPRGYKVALSSDGKTWGEPAATGKGELPVTAIQFKPAKTKFIRITETGSVSDRYWSIHELGIYEPGSTLAAKKTPVKPKVSYE
jgi:mono/diheme cytochrome c family protein